MSQAPGNSRVLRKYLDLYAEDEIKALQNLPGQTYQHALLIPAYRESTAFLQRLLDYGPKTRFLLIIISNHPSVISSASLEQALDAHHKMQHWLGEPIWTEANLGLYTGKKFDTILVNRTRPHSIPASEGVGLARKIGADIAAGLFLNGNLQTEWVMSSDADTHLPEAYFNIRPEKNASGLTYPFLHRILDDKIGQATALYEASINHYVCGLKRAGSPYAFHTVGSAQAVNLFAYARVRGYPKRSGGEDFYLLNKLAKVGEITQLEAPTIRIESRQSDRAPFGTGPAVKRLLESADMFAEPVFYHPHIFDHLKLVLDSLSSESRGELKQKLQQLPEHTRGCLQDLGLERALIHAEKQALSGQPLKKHFHDWFDGFRTLRFVHLMRDRAFPNISHKCRGNQASE